VLGWRRLAGSIKISSRQHLTAPEASMTTRTITVGLAIAIALAAPVHADEIRTGLVNRTAGRRMTRS
jgi:hypothetical protein